MKTLLTSIADRPWLQGTVASDAPVICDRAMGNISDISFLLGCGLKFLTAVPRTRSTATPTSSPNGLPWEDFLDFIPEASYDPYDEDCSTLTEAELNSATEAFQRDLARLRALATKTGLEMVEHLNSMPPFVL